MPYAFKQQPGKPLLQYLAQPLYDKKTVAASASQTLNFFKDFSSGFTPLTTNMNTASQIGYPDEFYAYGLGLHVESAVSKADLAKLLDYSYVTLKINQDEKLKAPLFMIPDCAGITGFATTTASATTIESVFNQGKQPFYSLLVDKGGPITIGSMELFELSVVMAAGSAPSTTFGLWMILYGVYGKSK